MAQNQNPRVLTLTQPEKDQKILLLEKQLKDQSFTIDDIDYIFQGIKEIINAGFKLHGGNTFNWGDVYVGICTNYEERVLKQHNVKDDYFVLKTKGEIYARVIERFCVNFRSSQGDTGGGTSEASPCQVYIYKIKEGTKQNIQDKVVKS